jgi:hypothetical protein
MSTGPLTINNYLINNNTTITGDLTVDGNIITSIDSTITGGSKTFNNADSGKIFHVSGTNTLVLPVYTTADTAWNIGIVNVGGNTLTINIAGSSGNTINDAVTISNTVKYSSIYIYRSTTTGKFIALGTLY